jgi:DHA3 family macrolide efflux protein-like MFS transporter
MNVHLLARLRALPAPAVLFVLARFASSLGSVVTTFALDVWIFQETGSYALFATFAVIAVVPAIVFSPFAGVLVDRLPHKQLIIACEIIAACAVTLVLAASTMDLWSPTLVGFAIVVLSLVRTVTWPAAGAVVTSLTTDEQRPRVNGLAETLDGVVNVSGPLLGALLFELTHVPGAVALDLLSYSLCIAVVARLTLPARASSRAPVAGGSPWSRLLSDCAFGFRWIAERRDMLRLLTFLALFNFGCSVFMVAYPPYILSFATPQFLGWCSACWGAGVLTGGAVFVATGGFRNHFHGMLFGAALMACIMIIYGIVRSPAWLLPLSFLYGAAFPFLSASSQTIWQSHVPVKEQGRVFAVRRMIAWALNPVAIALSIPLSTWIFAPLVGRADEASLASGLWGHAQAGALGSMISACGLQCFTVVLIVWIIEKSVRRGAPAAESAV